MDSQKAATILNLANDGLIIETMTKTADELIKDGYIKLEGEALARFSPVLKLIENIGFQQWINSSATKNVEEALKGAYRCIVDGKVLDKDILSKAKDSQLFREMILGEDGIIKHAAWEKIDPKELANSLGKAPAPNIVAIIFQVLAIATSQYYMHQMNQNYQTICTEIKSIKEQFMIQDASEIIAGYKSLTSMVDHFDSIMDSDNRRQSESIKTGQIEFDALKQIERCKLKLEKNFPLNSQKDSKELVESNIFGVINTLAQLKMSIYVFGMAKGFRVCFDDVNDQDEIAIFSKEIGEQINLYKDMVNKQIDVLSDYVSTSKALNKYSGKQIGGLVAVGLLAGPLAPGLVAGMEVKSAKNMKEKRDAQRKSIVERINANINLKDIDSLSSSVSFLEEYAASLDSKLEIVSNNREYYFLSKTREANKM